MRKFILPIIVFSLLFFGAGFVRSVQARTTSVKGYVKKSTGSFVMPHYKTSPNKTKFDNFSTKGNYNPYTGKKGYSSPYKALRFK